MKNIILQFVLFIISVCVINAQTDKITKINSDKIENAAERTQTSAGKVNGSNSTQATNAVTYDFTSSATAYFGGTAACTFVGINTETGDSVFAMIAGDANQSGIITNSDKDLVNSQVNQNGYYNSDVNMSGIVSNSDKDFINSNVNKSTQVPN